MTASKMVGDDGIGMIGRDNLTARVYQELRVALMEGRFKPGHRFKIRELAARMGVSETPIREAVMQLVREQALCMQASRSVEVAHLTAAQYEELRTVRLHLEGLASERATTRISDADIDLLDRVNAELFSAEKEARWSDAVRLNWQFHHTIYKAAGMPELLAIIEGIWLRNGPMINMHYPEAAPTYADRHQHLNVIDGLRARDPERVKQSIQADLVEGGNRLLAHLRDLEAAAARSAATA